MVTFLLAALVAYLVWAPFARWWAAGLPINRAADHGFSFRQVAVVATAILTLGIELYAVGTGSLKYPLFSYIRLLASAPETTQACLGFLAGIMWRTFPNWRITLGQGSTVRMSVFATAITSVVLSAVIAPHLRRVTAFETPYAKLQFETRPAEKQLELKIRRDFEIYENITTVTRTTRIIQSECAYAAIAAGGLTRFRLLSYQQRSPRYKDFQKAIQLRSELVDFLNQVAQAEHRGYDIEGLKRRVGIVADAFFRLLVEPDDDNVYKRFQDAKNALKTQADHLEPPQVHLDPEHVNWTWCASSKGDLNAAEIRGLLNRTWYIYGAVAVMFEYAGNTEAVIRVYRLAENRGNQLKYQLNVQGNLGEALYAGERQFEEVSNYLESALEIVQAEANKVNSFCGAVGTKLNSIHARICATLPKRYERAKLNIKVRLAYLWAQEGVRWPTAQAYAREGYDAIGTGRIRELALPCLDDYEEFNVKDTYAYVNLSFQAHNFLTDNIQPDANTVREARWVLEEMNTELKNKQRREDLPESCRRNKETALWLRRIGSHLKLAEGILR